jgi:hypothetical protein
MPNRLEPGKPVFFEFNQCEVGGIIHIKNLSQRGVCRHCHVKEVFLYGCRVTAESPQSGFN